MTTSRKRVRMPPVKPRQKTRTEQQSEQDKKDYEKLQDIARPRACRYIMVRGHDCAGKACTAPEHAAHLEKLTDVLMALGLIPDPEADWEIGPSYTSSKTRKRKAEAS